MRTFKDICGEISETTNIHPIFTNYLLFLVTTIVYYNDEQNEKSLNELKIFFGVGKDTIHLSNADANLRLLLSIKEWKKNNEL